MKFLQFGLAFACLAVPVYAHEAEGHTFEDNETNGVAERSFSYSYGPQVAAHPILAAVIRAQEEAALAKQKAQWNEAVEEFGDIGCITCVAQLYTNTWEMAATTERFLILQSERWTYTGGAHGNSFFSALGWDHEGGEAGEGAAFRPVDMFVNETALENTAFGDYCAALLEQKGERLELDTADMNPFDGCPSVTELVVIPLSSDGEQFDRLRFLAAPYVAGSYAEGPYSFEIPVTEAMLGVVRQEFADHFALGDQPAD